MFALKAPSVKPHAGRKLAGPVNAAPDRRAVLAGLVAGVSSLTGGKALADATPVDLFDDRKAKSTGFEIIYEARDLDLDQNQRDGISQFRGDLTATKARYNEAARRINTNLGEYVSKAYWTEAKEELRLQVGNFRQDLRTLANSKASKPERKEALAQAKDLIQTCEALDLAIRQKNQDAANKNYAAVVSKIGKFTDSVA